MPPAVGYAIAGIAGAAGVFGAAKVGSSAAKRASRYQTEAANRAAELEAQSARDALAFAKDQEAQRRREWEDTQRRNYEIYLQKRGDLAPYRRLGAGTIGQISEPIPGLERRPGTLGALMGG